MAKRKKTLKQKLLSDSRRKAIAYAEPKLSPNSEINAITENKYVLKKTLFKPNSASINTTVQPSLKPDISTVNYRYLRTDLLKTIFLTSFIIAVELVFKFIVKGF